MSFSCSCLCVKAFQWVSLLSFLGFSMKKSPILMKSQEKYFRLGYSCCCCHFEYGARNKKSNRKIGCESSLVKFHFPLVWIIEFDCAKDRAKLKASQVKSKLANSHRSIGFVIDDVITIWRSKRSARANVSSKSFHVTLCNVVCCCCCCFFSV